MARNDASGQPAPDGKRVSTRRKRAVSLVVAFMLLLCALAIVACSPASTILGTANKSGSSGVTPSAKTVKKNDTWTVLVYMCGSNLESQAGYASDNIKEMQKASIPENVHFVMETGGSNQWQNEVISPDNLERYEISGGMLYKVDSQPRTSMADQETFSDFLKWGVKNYPADHYMLVFWDHGGGSLSGVCQDELDKDNLTLPELTAGIAEAGVTFDVIGFDTCLMATLETAQMLSPYANYMVASEEVEPACGWAWQEWPGWFNEPSESAADLGKTICDTYFAKCTDKKVADTVTLSVVDLSKIDAVASTFETASRDLAADTEKPGQLQRIIIYGGDSKSFGHADYVTGYTNMVDMRDLVSNLSDSLSESGPAVQDAIDQAVVYEVHGKQSDRSNGLSLFYPLKIDEETFKKYFKLSTENGLNNVPYLQFLAARTGTYDIVNWADQGVPNLDPVSSDDAKGAFQYKSSINSEGRYVIDITGNTEYLSVTTFALGQLLDDGTVAMLGSDNNLDLQIDQKTGAVRYTDNFEGTWYKIGDAFVYADIVDMVGEGTNHPLYKLYTTPVEWTTKNSQGKTVTFNTNVLSMYDYTTNRYEVLCVYEDADETGMVGKSTVSLSKGDKLKFLTSRNVNGKVESGSTGTITWSDDVKMIETYAGDATYVYIATITDIFGNEYRPDAALITYKDGKRSAELVKLDSMK